jgi:acyl carrier protein
MARADDLAVEDWMAQWFARRGNPLPRADHGLADIDFLETGLLDSIAMIDLIMDIESRFDIRLTSEMMRDPRFPRTAGLARIIEETARR